MSFVLLLFSFLNQKLLTVNHVGQSVCIFALGGGNGINSIDGDDNDNETDTTEE